MERAPKKTTRSCNLITILVLASFLFATFSQAAELVYPTRPIDLVVSSEAGGFGDLGPRILNSKLPEILGVPVVISNKPHASGAAAVEAVVRAKPDGYTLLASANAPLVLVPLMNPQVPYTFRKLLPIAGFGYGFNGIVVHSDS